MPARPPRFQSFLSLGPQGFHRVAYTEWGDPANPHIVVCAHGLARNSRDFDYLAARLARDCRVVCIDLAGRGASEWLADARQYGAALYQSDAAALLARITGVARDVSFSRFMRHVVRAGRVARVDWVGSSMGGLIGLLLAAQAHSPIGRLVLNDVGPDVPPSALARLGKMGAAAEARFPDLDAVERYLRQAYKACGALTAKQWRHVARHSVQPAPEGGYMLAFDPSIVNGVRGARDGAPGFGADFLLGEDLWQVWDAVRCPTLVLRGAKSDLLLAATAAQMTARGPRAQVVELAGAGHAPWLMSAGQIRVVREFLLTA
jgi:pimeloyl-ACP methyl ester carboxylesterase